MNTRFGPLRFRGLARLIRQWRKQRFALNANDDRAPLRAELFSTEQMEQHGKALARIHTLSNAGPGSRLLKRLDDNEQVLIVSYDLLTAAVAARLRISPAGEWLLDNFYLIEEQIRAARLHLPKGYSRELPRLARGPSSGLPRVYDLALEAISHGDGRVDAQALLSFVAAYQTVTPLTLGELWAIPIMLRLALIENLRRVGARISADRRHVNQAQNWADQMIEMAANDPKNLILVIADMARSAPPMVGPFIAELARRLQGHGPALALPLTWIEQHLAESSLTIERVVLSENQQQAADQVSISNSIGSLRFLGAMDWRVFVETMSIVEAILGEDAADSYRAMDFASRDRYRHVVDRIAKQSQRSEAEVARMAIDFALHAHGVGGEAHTTHVGYYLIDQGLGQLERAAAARLPPLTRIRRWLGRSPLTLYLGALALTTTLSAWALLALLSGPQFAGWQMLAPALLAILAASKLAAALVNWLATQSVIPQRLPRMDFSQGIPSTMSTLVVVPCLLLCAENVDELVESLEVRFLGNQDEHLYFCLLSDFRDASEPTLASDQPLLQRAQLGIEKLNAQYGSANSDRFFLLHRQREWNPADRVWMGFERKRGKLAALNSRLRGGSNDDFALLAGNFAALGTIKYVITLDTDTQLPRESARQFVGAMAHPLNRARLAATGHRIDGGYGILQPRMAASLSAANRSRYAQLFGSEPGIDPYTCSVSDVYQDGFGEGSFIGKGIYDVDAFEAATAGRFPDNRILSHDLLEGCYARSGLLSDVHLYEEYPARYQTDMKRRERWIRGDWQIAHWVLAKVPSVSGSRLPNPLSMLSRWKIFDNLRRSLVASALVLLLLLGWGWVAAAGWWTLAIVGSFLIPPVLIALVSAVRKPASLRLGQHLGLIAQALIRNCAQAGFRIACLPHEAALSLNAILRSTGRMLFTHRLLLEWNSCSEQAQGQATGLTPMYRAMWVVPALAVATAIALTNLRPDALAAAAPLLGLWLAAPGIAWWLSLPLLRREPKLSADQLRFLHRIARKTWAFFDRFVSAEDHWLVPDNYQEHPGPALAQRTSPTNIGMALLANLAACDFGYISTGSLLKRSAQSFATLATLERHQGHYYNWYDTVTLAPLAPRYVSTVDSGNFAAHLLTLRAGLLALPEQPIFGPRVFDGLIDTLALCSEAGNAAATTPLAHLRTLLQMACDDRPQTLLASLQHLDRVTDSARALCAALDTDVTTTAAQWAAALERQCQDARDELMHLAPWLVLATTHGGIGDCFDLDSTITLSQLAARTAQSLPVLDAQLGTQLAADQRTRQTLHRELIAVAGERATERIAAIADLAVQATGFADMSYDFLYDHTRHLLAIGYNVDAFRRDACFYDLLASEARLCNFVAIAQGQLPQESWFALGRLLTTAGGEPVLLSWSGSMFEYLMPLLVMPSYEGTLLEQTCRAAVVRQIAYGSQRSLPWGVSESGYNTVDASRSYQYHAFGVPGLGLKRGLAEDLVVAPYASALALMVAPEAACSNLQRLAASGMEGQYGFFEAIDYTPSRLPRGQSSVIVRSFMAHHQGMNLLALAALLLDRPMQRRFESDPQFQATLLLLQERTVQTSIFHTHVDDHSESSAFGTTPSPSAQTPIGAETPTPQVQLLSNSRYQVMISNAGSGYSRWNQLALTRWREDSTRDHWGTFIYLRDADSGRYWSATHQPTLQPADSYEALFTEGRAEFRRRDQNLETYTEIMVSPEDDIELRRVRISNHSRHRRSIEITSYAEVVLAMPAADSMQPGFGNLFVQTEIIANRRAILCTRRPRSIGEQAPWMMQLMATNGTAISAVSYETDRMRFIGRGNTLQAPRALSIPGALSDTDGSVLDPIVAIRCRVTLEPEQSATIDLITGAANSREACMLLVDKYQDRHLADRVCELACTHGEVTLRQINASEADAHWYRQLASSVIYANAALRADAGVVIQNRRGQSGLWAYAISGDLPIVLLKIADSTHLGLARQMIQCHAYWRLKGLAVDLVIWNEEHVGYRQQLHDQIMGLIVTGSEAQAIDRPGGIFVRSGEQISHEDRILLQAVARVIVADSAGDLAAHLSRVRKPEKRMARLTPTRSYSPQTTAVSTAAEPELMLSNGLGGFNADGSEYCITTTPTKMTPLPWANVLANAHFGTVISEGGVAYTWSENSHEFRLTPWSEDPVAAGAGEAIYLRDEETGHYWSPTPMPCRDSMPYLTRHGFGYSVFEHTADGIRTELWVYVDLHEAVKFSVLKVHNQSGRNRRLSATGYVEWVLGDLRPKSAMHVVTELDPGSGALFARNAFNTEFAGRVAFFDVDDLARSYSGDRNEFLGRNGSLQFPQAMTRTRLSGKLGAALDPCGAIQVPFELDNGAEREIIFHLGAGRDRHHARELAKKLRVPGTARGALQQLRQYWQHTLGAVHIETPDPALNLLSNGWLVYQTLVSRLWARSGFYQSGGAFGFRDQLQDVMALVHTEPQLVRAHLLLCAERQFSQGDVQHWWHPPLGRGVRTRCSDDFLWLPLAVSRYVCFTGDNGVLDETVHFLEGRSLTADEESYYDQPTRSPEVASLYQHCLRAIEHGLRFGAHGLPLMGSGDWNDGMNLVGIEGKGESVWLGFFLYKVLLGFAVVADQHSDPGFATRCREQAAQLQKNLEQHAWDGDWYRRAWFDDGSPLGSAANAECRIDSIAQSWSVLSAAGSSEHMHSAMNALDQHLVHRDVGLIQLLDPPFDKAGLNPGYIQGYVPGVRENGGQYTHAAVWAAMAFATLGDSSRAWALLDLINPLKHAQNALAVATYKAEPYVVAADVYAFKPHTGRGGWTWYTGSAGWLYRLIVESLLGLNRQGDRLQITPCLPEDWTHYTMRYRFGTSLYRIEVQQSLSADSNRHHRISVDGIDQGEHGVGLIDDQQEHVVAVQVERARPDNAAKATPIAPQTAHPERVHPEGSPA